MKAKKIFLSIAIIVTTTINAQTPTEQIANKMHYVFARFETHQVPTGILSNYGVQPIDLESYNGVLSDSNYVDLKNFVLIYSGLYSAKINNNISLQNPDNVVQKIENAQHNSSTPVAFMSYRYNKFKEYAVQAGILSIQNGQIVRSNYYRSPYETKTLFAITPQKTHYNKANVSFVFKPNLKFSNITTDIESLQIRFDKTLPYVTTHWNSPISYTYSESGVKKITFKVNYSDGTSYKSQTNILVTFNNSKSKRGTILIDDSISIPKNNKHSGGKLQIKLAPGNYSGKIKKALIVAEGFDPMEIMGRKNMDIYNFLDERSDYGRINYFKISPNLYNELQYNDYDIVYLDYNNGIDDIRRNAALMQEAITWVNNHKIGNHPNIVMGISMGGLVARYALRKMELAGIDHQTWKYISIDSPHKGANVPVGLQAAARHIDSESLELFFIKIAKTSWFLKQFKGAIKILNSKAAKQMLIYNVSGNGYDNSEHNEFMTEYEALGFPKKCQNIAVSNGNNRGNTLFNNGETILKYNKTINLKWWMEIVNMYLARALDLLPIYCNHPEILLNRIPGKTQIKISATVNSIKGNSQNRVYYGKIQLKKKIFWTINSSVNITKKSHYTNYHMLPIDNAPGGIYDSKDKGFNNMLHLFKQRKFCFVPTVSALAINNWQGYLNSNLSGQDLFANGKTDFEYTYSPKNSEEHTVFNANTNFLRNHVKASPIYINSLKETFCGQQTVKIKNPKNKAINWSVSNNNFTLTSSSKTSTKIKSPLYATNTIIKASSGEVYPLRKKIFSTCNVEIIGSSIICEGDIYTIKTIPVDTPVEWDATYPLEAYESPTDTPLEGLVVNTDPSGKYEDPAMIYATIYLEGEKITLTKEVHLGIPQYIYSDIEEPYVDEKGFLQVDFSGATDYTWTKEKGALEFEQSDDPSMIFFRPYDSGEIIFKVVASNECGSAEEVFYLYSEFEDDDYYYSISPNPATNYVTIAQKNKNKKANRNKQINKKPYKIQLWNSLGLVKEVTTDQEAYQLSLQGLPAGFYYVHIIKGKEITRKQLVIK